MGTQLRREGVINVDADRVEKTIMINNKEVIVKIDKFMDKSKSKKIIDDFCLYIRQMKSGIKKLETYKPSDFDYIAIISILKHCTDFIPDKMNTFVDVTIKYTELVTKNILQQIFKSLSGEELSRHIDDIIIRCRVILQNEISTKRLENMLPSFFDETSDFKIIKINKGNNKEEQEKLKAYLEKLKELSSRNKKPKKEDVHFDDLLDQYNDAKMLHGFFGDEEYDKKAKSVLAKIKRRWKKTYGDEKNP